MDPLIKSQLLHRREATPVSLSTSSSSLDDYVKQRLEHLNRKGRFVGHRRAGDVALRRRRKALLSMRIRRALMSSCIR